MGVKPKPKNLWSLTVQDWMANWSIATEVVESLYSGRESAAKCAQES